jgi:hypothetical protein
MASLMMMTMMTRHSLIPFLSGRGADPRFGVRADLRPFGRETPFRMRVSDPPAARQVTNRRIKIKPGQNHASPLDREITPEAIIPLD